ncbi:MAG: hypothetical protein A2W33_03080 [Chloroflexi bacterium RBG_16_52_11]|nr:MAG: hypothetical protein A2W33_03080 [Chloroflexi bacterium RBG_16_52_11]
MKKVWPWIFGIAFALIIIAQVATDRSTKQYYWVARGAMGPRVVIVQEQSDQALKWRLHHYYQR